MPRIRRKITTPLLVKPKPNPKKVNPKPQPNKCLPEKNIYVVAGVTSIPARESVLVRSLESLVQQTYSFRSIVVTLPKKSMRGKSGYTDAACERIKTISPLIEIFRPEKDLGPIMKYIGPVCLHPNAEYCFACDDDQDYHRGLLEKMLLKAQNNPGCVIQNWLNPVINNPLGDHVHGFVANLYPRKYNDVLEDFIKYVPEKCLWIDDQVVGLYWWLKGVPIINGESEFETIFAKLEDGHEFHETETALHAESDRKDLKNKLYAYFGFNTSRKHLWHAPSGPYVNDVSEVHLACALKNKAIVVGSVYSTCDNDHITKTLRRLRKPPRADLKSIIFSVDFRSGNLSRLVDFICCPAAYPVIVTKSTVSASTIKTLCPWIEPHAHALTFCGQPDSDVSHVHTLMKSEYPDVAVKFANTVQLTQKLKPWRPHGVPIYKPLCFTYNGIGIKTMAESQNLQGKSRRKFAFAEEGLPPLPIPNNIQNVDFVRHIKHMDTHYMFFVHVPSSKPYLMMQSANGRIHFTPLQLDGKDVTTKWAWSPYVHGGELFFIVTFKPYTVVVLENKYTGQCRTVCGNITHGRSINHKMLPGSNLCPWIYPFHVGFACHYDGKIIPIIIDVRDNVLFWKSSPLNMLKDDFQIQIPYVLEPVHNDFCLYVQVDKRYDCVVNIPFRHFCRQFSF